MKKKLLALLMMSIIVLGACGGDSSDDNGNNANDANGDNGAVTIGNAEQLYNKKCAGCHGKDLEGGASSPPLATIGNTLSAEEIASIIENGTDQGMPAKLVKDDDAKEVAEWLSEKK